ncbi:MAG: hypothetical protein A2Y25_07415 [Candidatus Melainabacteria bacterium GWF2_37_15]|nr:MAG: hypothetical protein A2Y25_07415 [Candidatus Melainabacteria bacterium GWF2_37_15]
MRVVKYLLLIGLVVMIMPAFALKSTEVSEEKYLLDHGHSDEIVRMMELQKSRLEGDKPEHKEFKTSNRIVKFFKNLFYERDITMPLNDFGQDRVTTVESPKR